MKAASFFKGLSYLLVLNVLVKPLWIFGIDRQIQNVVAHQSYGVYFALLNLSIVLSFLTDAGITNMMNQRLAAGQQLHMPQIIRLKILLSLLYAVAVIFIAWLSSSVQWTLLLPVIGIQVLTSFFVLLRNAITAHQLFNTDAWLSVLDKSLMILFCAPFLYGATTFNNILFYLYLQLICTSIAVIVATTIIIKKGFLKSTERKENIKAILKISAPFAVIILLMSAHNRLDAFLLERIHSSGAYQAGIYASAYRLLDAANVMGYMVASFLVPFVARNLAEKNIVQSAVLTARHVLMISGITAAVFIIVFAQEVQNVLYHLTDKNAVTVMQLCIAVLPAYIMVHIYGSVLTATAQLKKFIVIIIISVVINVAVNLLLIPKYGAVGCCIAAIASQYFFAGFLYWHGSKTSGISYGLKSMFIYAAIATILFLFFYSGKLLSLHPMLLLSFAGIAVIMLLLLNIGIIKKYFVLLR